MDIQGSRYIDSLRSVLGTYCPTKRCSLIGYADERLCLEPGEDGWAVYNADHGRKAMKRIFDSPYAACLDFLDRIVPADKKVAAMDDFLAALSATGGSFHFGAYGAACAR